MIEPKERQVEHFLRTGDGDFESLSLQVFRHQYEKNIPYQTFCKVQGKDPQTVDQCKDIPAIPIGAFKSSELATFPVGQAAAVFHSGGPPEQPLSRHYLRSLRYYETSLSNRFERWLRPESRTMPFLV